MDKTTYEAAYKQLDDADMGDAPALKDKMAGADEPAETAIVIMASEPRAENPVKAAAKAQSEAESKEFSDAYNEEKTPPLKAEPVQAQPEPAEPATFREAFSKARAAMKAGGPNVFEFKGKKYSTATKEDAAAKKAAEPKTEAKAEVKKEAPTAKAKSIYAGSIADTLPAMIKDKLDDKVEYTGQRHASGKPNLAPAR
jgi:hypothetical protein